MAKRIIWLGLFLIMAFSAAGVFGQPCEQNYATWGSNINMTITNWGLLGSAQDPNMIDPDSGFAAPACQFPANSDLEYLFMGSIWIGAIVGGDTLVSCGTDGWWDSHELFPDPCPVGEMQVIDTTTYREIIGVFYDTNITYAEIDPIDQRPHIPIGVRITIHTYSWNEAPWDDFVIIRYNIENISDHLISDIWIGVMNDGDVHHTNNSGSGAQDDIAGFINDENEGFAWIIDNDGDPDQSNWSYESVRSICGLLVLSPTDYPLATSHNWWISNVNSQLDWGPQWIENYYGSFPGGGRGTPGGDAARYRVMSNGEHDYNQTYAAIDYTAGGPNGHDWISPLADANARDVANGYDTRYLISFGSFDLYPGQSNNVDMAMVGGEFLHTQLDNYANNLYGHETDTTAIRQYYNNLDFSDFESNAEMAQLAYDSIISSVSEVPRPLPVDYSLFQNYPNPFNPATIIKYSLPAAGRVNLTIYNILGQKVATLIDELQPAGHKLFKWDASSYASGIYFYRLTAGNRSFTKRMTLLK